MSSPHGWTPAAMAGYVSPTARKAEPVADFHDDAAALAKRYAGDLKGHQVEYANLCLANADLADQVPEIREQLDALTRHDV